MKTFIHISTFISLFKNKENEYGPSHWLMLQALRVISITTKNDNRAGR